MRELEVRRCPVCGAPVAAGAPRCDYCQAPLESVHCAACFSRNPSVALHCLGCGGRLGLEPLDVATELECPACQTPFRAFGASTGKLAECTHCAGQFVEHALLEELLERREVHHGVTRALPPRENPLTKPVSYVKCPACKTVMNRNNFGGSSGVVVDVCPHHGVWFEPGELPRILRFVQAGGLERSRQRARKEQTERERAQRISAADLRAPGLRGAEHPELTGSLAAHLSELLDIIGDAFRRLR